jgi:hypothetical protein
VSFEEIVESRIRDAQEQGAFRGLAGEGRPLNLDETHRLAGDRWAAFRVLENANMLPEWLELAKDIERWQQELARADRRHADVVALGRSSGDWAPLLPSLRARRRDCELIARELRARQDRFNIEAPSFAGERPAIWVEYHLEKLDRTVAEAGGPGVEALGDAAT